MRVRVIVRVRPLSSKEKDQGREQIVHVDRKESAIRVRNPDADSREAPRSFTFDNVNGGGAEQKTIYDETAAPIVEAALQGYNGTIFAYGQTGAGKTHTLGNVNKGSEGVVWRALSQILGNANGNTTVSLSYVQIYMEQIYDLLDPQANVDLREDPKEGVVLTGAMSEPLTDIEQAVNVIETANRNRVTSATAMNDSSSRSHSVLLLDVTTRAGAKILKGKLHLVDLAGSERVKKSEVQGQAFDEAVAINNSLTTLGRCVQALAAGPKGGKPPFRDTKLTSGHSSFSFAKRNISPLRLSHSAKASSRVISPNVFSHFFLPRSFGLISSRRRKISARVSLLPPSSLCCVTRCTSARISLIFPSR